MRVIVTAVTMTAVIGKLLNLAKYWCGFCVLDMLAVPITDLPASDVRCSIPDSDLFFELSCVQLCSSACPLPFFLRMSVLPCVHDVLVPPLCVLTVFHALVFACLPFALNDSRFRLVFWSNIVTCFFNMFCSVACFHNV